MIREGRAVAVEMKYLMLALAPDAPVGAGPPCLLPGGVWSLFKACPDPRSIMSLIAEAVCDHLGCLLTQPGCG